MKKKKQIVPRKFNYFGGVRYSYDSLPQTEPIMVRGWGPAFQF